MRLEVLGSGGAITTPRPGCDCAVCVEARERGVPYARTGPSYFLHGPDVLFDTPEESKAQLNRSRIGRVAAAFYSHWHPDHVMGRRVWEELNYDWRGYPPRPRRTPVYLPEQVAADFRERLGSWDHLAFLAQIGVVEPIEVHDGETIVLDGTVIRPFRLAEAYVYAFVLEGDGKRVLLAPDELYGWEPGAELGSFDLAVLPMGVCELDPFTGERKIAREHPVLRAEATFEETLGIVERLRARRVVLSHIEEPDGLSHDRLQELGRRHDVEFAHDTMVVEL